MEVIDAIISFKGWNRKDIIKIKNEKAKTRGKFDRRIILEES